MAGEFSRRDFLQVSGVSLAAVGSRSFTNGPNGSDESFAVQQERRRKELWGLLGDLPWNHRPGPAQLVSREDHDGYVLERLVLDLNGQEPVPAVLLIPKKRAERAPGLLFIHWHAGMYDLGKEQLIRGVKAQPAYAPVLAEKGIVTLAIDSWCFGERKHEHDGGKASKMRSS